MSLLSKSKLEFLVRVFLIMVVVFNITVPRTALALSPKPANNAAIQSPQSPNIVPKGASLGEVISGSREQASNSPGVANLVSLNTSTLSPTFTPTPEVKEGVQFDLSASSNQAFPGDDVEYTISITNNEKEKIAGFSFSNLLPDQFLNPKSENKDLQFDPKTNTLTWELDKGILPGETITLQYTVTIKTQIIEEIVIVDEADLFIDGKETSLIATSELAIFPKGEDKEFTGLGSAGGKAEDIDGNVSIDVPAGELKESEGILIEDISDKYKADPSDLLFVFQLDVVSQATQNASPTVATEAPTTLPTLTPTLPTKEPSLTPTISETQTSTPTPVASATAALDQDLRSETPELPTSTETMEEDVSESDENNSEALVEENVQDLTPTPIVSSTVEPTIVPTFDVDVSPSPTTTLTPTIVPSPTTLLDTSTATPSPTSTQEETSIPIIEFQEQDFVSTLKIEEAKFEKQVELEISLDGLVDLSKLPADQTPFLVTLDENSNSWVRVPLSSIDRKNNTIAAEVTHFSTWGAGIGPAFPAPGANVLLFDNANPDLFTGRAKFSMPIWTPPGRNGMAPALSLSYSSGKVDGILANAQAPWVGMGWNIDTVEIARKIAYCTASCSPAYYGYENKFLLLFNGTGYELLPDTSTAGRFHTKSESFLYIQLHNDDLGNNSPTASNTTGEWWEVVERDGTRWRLGWTNDSEQLASMVGYPGDDTGPWSTLGYAGHAQGLVTYRWRADRVVDTFGNGINFSYFEEHTGDLAQPTPKIYDSASYIETIIYTTHTSGTPASGYSVAFIREARDVVSSTIAGANFDNFRLDRIDVKYGATVMRTYDLGYQTLPYTDESITHNVLALTTIAVSGSGINAPTTTFGYTGFDNRANCGSGCQEWTYPRLTSISNGSGGTSTYIYSNDARPSTSWYNWRVDSQSVSDGVNANPMKTTFAYLTPCYNDTSAGWCNGSNIGELIGYGQTTETDKDFNGTTSLAITVHKFHTDQQQFGHEYEVQHQDGSGSTISKTLTSYTVDTSGLPTGGFYIYPSEVSEYLNTGGLTLVSETNYLYDNTKGNLTRVTEYDDGAFPYRTTYFDYVFNTSPSIWILDKLTRSTLKDAMGNVVAQQEYGYDGNLPGVGSPSIGELTLSRNVNPLTNQTIDTEYTSDAYGNITTSYLYKSYSTVGSSPAAGAVITNSTAYDATLKTYVVASDPPLLPAKSTGYDYGLGLPTTETDANGNTTTTTYDGLGRVTQITYPGSAQANIKYTYPTLPVSAPFSVKMEAWDQTASVYRSAWQIFDGIGRVIQTQSPYETAGNLVLNNTSYNALGLKHYEGLPVILTGSGGGYHTPTWGSLAHTTTSYDALGRVTSVMYPDSSIEATSYSGLNTTFVDRNNHQKVQKTDVFGRLLRIDEYIGSGPYTLYATTTYEYDTRNLLKKVIDAQGNQTIIGYNGFARKDSISDPDMGAWSYAYDVVGNLTSQTDARGCVITFTYDDLKRLTGKTYTGPGACDSTPDVTLTYDSNVGGNEGWGHRTGMSDANSSTSWFYNTLGQVTNETHNIESTNYSLAFTYDAFNRPLTETLPNAEVLNFSYNAAGALSGLAGTNTYTSQIHYNAGGQVTDQLLGNGLVQQFCYDSNTLRATNIRAYPGSVQSCGVNASTPRLNLSYTYQPNGNVSQVVDATRSETLNYTYDELDRLLNVNGTYSQNFSYGTTGNIITKGTAGIASPIIAFTSVTSGFDHSCGLTLGGAVKCWGSNGNGQLGDGTTTSRFTPVAVSGLSSGVIAIEAGGFYTCALLSTGGVKCWGQNDQGQLGDGTTAQKLTPVSVSGLASGVSAISAGYQSTCALLSTGGVKCWGNNTNGALGDGTYVNQTVPTNVSGLASGVSAISVGIRHACALTTGGGIKCWGLNTNGQLGDGTTANKNVPTNVSGLTTGVTAVSAGEIHTCALTTTGGVKCWGGNVNGQLGDGTTAQQLTAVNVSGLSSGVASLAAGNFHTCVKTITAVMKCWGKNDHSQLGDGNITASQTTPVNVGGSISGFSTMAPGISQTCVLIPNGRIKCWGENNTFGRLGDGTTIQRTIPTDVNWITNGSGPIEAGGFHSCALDGGGGVRCWGDNVFGQLGDNTTIDKNIPVSVSGLTTGVIAITTGGNHSCALTSAGGVKCWGNNGNGQLGDGTTANKSTPVDVSGLTTGVIAISAGAQHTCALTATSVVKCWGLNATGQLGNNSTTQSTTPVTVSGLAGAGETVIAISVGEQHSCAVSTISGNTGVKCWGANTYGQIGDGTNAQRLTAVAVSGLTSGITTVAAGNYQTCALTNTGGVKCWGHNHHGQLGNNSLSDSNVPVNVNGLTSSALSINGGIDQTCAKTDSGGMKCWGNNGNGRLGDNTTTDRLIPTDVFGLTSGVLSVTTGYNHTCALTISGEKCWGYNVDGEIGNGNTTQQLTAVSVIIGSNVAAYTYNDTAHKHAATAMSTGETFSYDANGNMIQRIEGGLTYTQTFDAENRLVSVTVSGQTTQFIYDGDGNLVKKIKPDASKTLYVAGVYEVDKTSAGVTSRTVTYYPGTGAMRINSTLYYILKDQLHSANVVTNNTGTVVGEQRYYPYGETRVASGTMLTDKLFTEQREMAGLGMYNYGARFYSPKVGRFLSADTIVPNPASPQSFNRYSYGLNNPIRYNDPTGHEPGDCYDRGYCLKFSSYSGASATWAQKYGKKSYGGYLQTYALAGIAVQNPNWVRPKWLPKKDGIYTGEGIAKVTDAEMRTPYGAPITDSKGKFRGIGLGMRLSDQNDTSTAVEAMMTRIVLRTNACDDKCTSTDIFLAAALGQNGPFFNPQDMNYLTNGAKYKPRPKTTHSLQWQAFLTNIEEPKDEAFNRELISQFAHNVLILRDEGWDVPDDIDWNYVYSLTIMVEP
jgi:RHS repeat-associated protein/uncharacterized repeat protein (TIGR01451 family)